MQADQALLDEVKYILPHPYLDERGLFMELYQEARYLNLHDIGPFVQDNLSISKKNVIRGMHFQEGPAQGKLVTVIKGEIFDVVVDIRKNSPTYKQWKGFTLNDKKRAQLYIPQGFAHGFATLSDEAIVLYKVTAYYDPKKERGFRYDDKDIGIQWPIKDPILSSKDARAFTLSQVQDV